MNSVEGKKSLENCSERCPDYIKDIFAQHRIDLSNTQYISNRKMTGDSDTAKTLQSFSDNSEDFMSTMKSIWAIAPKLFIQCSSQNDSENSLTSCSVPLEESYSRLVKEIRLGSDPNNLDLAIDLSNLAAHDDIIPIQTNLFWIRRPTESLHYQFKFTTHQKSSISKVKTTRSDINSKSIILVPKNPNAIPAYLLIRESGDMELVVWANPSHYKTSLLVRDGIKGLIRLILTSKNMGLLSIKEHKDIFGRERSLLDEENHPIEIEFIKNDGSIALYQYQTDWKLWLKSH